MRIITDNLIRIIVLDITNLYASVCDEAYLTADRYDLHKSITYNYLLISKLPNASLLNCRIPQ